MIGLLQRVTGAEVRVDDEVIAHIATGLVILVGVERGDTEREAARLLDRVLGYRVFPDRDGRMNRSVAELDGAILLIPQFTLAADTRKGTRASFTPAATPAAGRRLFEALLTLARARHPHVAAGRFGAHMQVSLTNDGPVTFWLQVAPPP
ncbi:MAG: D-tyrosyl-tRNA(Tyr) deacylase [Chromatiales bacterium 21-64-14]|nr:MAG: D-tyrosyl-tRNA(Tyr) deacylase [Chromatiales bacterium 21-64-14]HQU15744.1 D-aminoacyl-tRNA deacylase [Gammaproteobacteria bacterium]